MPDAELTDPLGRRIRLHDRTWYGHILKAHPEMGRRDHAWRKWSGHPMR